jgi:hypothetical protein
MRVSGARPVLNERLIVLEIAATAATMTGTHAWQAVGVGQRFMPGMSEFGVIMLLRIEAPLATLAKSPSLSSVLVIA